MGNSQCSRPEAVRKRRKRRTKVKGKTLVIGCASLWRLRGRAQNPLRRPKPPLPDCIQCHCPSAVCGPRSRMSPRYGRKDKPAKAKTHRIEEGVAATLSLLVPFAGSARGKRTPPTHYTEHLYRLKSTDNSHAVPGPSADPVWAVAEIRQPGNVKLSTDAQ